MGEWPVVQLGSLAAKTPGAIAIGPFGSKMKADTYSQKGVPVIRGTNISSERSWKGDWVYISEEFADTMPNCNAFAGDLVFPHRGAIGEVAIIPDDGSRYMLSTSLMKFRADAKKASSLFLFYYFRSVAGRNEILTYSSQVGTPGIGQPLSSLRMFRAPLPPLRVQHTIASILGALDDKIDLNRRMNETLEAMARALFKDWFVDFGPSRARMAGREPYLAPELWALFPDRLDDEGVPKGWKRRPLDEIANFLNGLALQKHPGTGQNDLPVIKIAELKAGITAKSGWASRSLPSQYIVRDGDILFSWSGSLTHLVWTNGEGALNQHLFKVTSEHYPKWFVYYWLSVHMPEFQSIASSKATTMGHIQRGHLSAAETIVPPGQILENTGKLISPIFDKMIKNCLESRTLAQTRDLLLPKLMSGEIRVKEAEKLLEAAR